MRDTLVTVTNVSRTFRIGNETIRAVSGVSLYLGAGEIVLIQGKSGSGKTTLLNLMGGLDTPSEGTVRFGGSAPDSPGSAYTTRNTRSGYTQGRG